jgi:hypothetical protein
MATMIMILIIEKGIDSDALLLPAKFGGGRSKFLPVPRKGMIFSQNNTHIVTLIKN